MKDLLFETIKVEMPEFTSFVGEKRVFASLVA